MLKKAWYRSKTIWFNGLTTLVALATMPEVLGIIPEEYLKWVMFGAALGNLYLRSVTNTGLSKADDDPFMENMEGK